MVWTALLKGGLCTCSLSHEWDDVPDSVLAVVASLGYDGHGRTLAQVYQGSDWYGFDGERFYIGKTSDVRGEWVPCDVPGLAKKGVWASEEEYAAVQKEIAEMVA